MGRQARVKWERRAMIGKETLMLMSMGTGTGRPATKTSTGRHPLGVHTFCTPTMGLTATLPLCARPYSAALVHIEEKCAVSFVVRLPVPVAIAIRISGAYRG